MIVRIAIQSLRPRADLIPLLENDIMQTHEKGYNNRMTNLIHAFQDFVLPCNPIPFAQGLKDYVRDNGSDSIQDDKAKAMFWVLLAQAYDSMATIDMCDESMRLDKAIGE